VALALLVALSTSAAWAGPREQARRMHDRLVGVPPTQRALDAMAQRIGQGDAVGAAYLAMTHPLFFSSSLKNFATPWTNEARTVFDDLNDYSATVIGMIRDDVPFDQVLSADLVYVGAPGVVQSAYSHQNNDHYLQLEQSYAELSNPSVLVGTRQSALPGTPFTAADTAGVITTRSAARAFFSAGTNRRMWRFIAINYLCRDMEALADITRSSSHVRQDVSRSPGGDSRVFLNTCVGCHSGMDGLAGAFAYFDWDAQAERISFTPRRVQAKNLINAVTFPGGYVTTDDSWVNHWRSGPNASLGWRGAAGAGNGPKSLGQEVGASRAFSECQVKKVFERICLRPPSDAADRAEVQRIADLFDSQNRSMKRVFAETATYCMGQ
jgi:hypothetical protein